MHKAGDLITLDCRTAQDKLAFSSSGVSWFGGSASNKTTDPQTTLKCVQWNVERGYKLDAVIDTLRRHHADIICLQELDIDCERSSGRNCPQEIAEALQMKLVMLVEFEECHSPLRPPHLQGGGVHGNAILSRFDLAARVLPHSHHPIDWHAAGIKLREPRVGERAILAADVMVPGLASPLLCYSLHLEVFCGIFGRLRQFGDVLEDSRQHAAERPYQLIFGDLNTMAHGIARFSSLYCRDWLRWGSLGFSEAAWWQDRVLSVTCDSEALTEDGGNGRLQCYVPRNLSSTDVRRLVNPHFFDPFCMETDTTLHGYRGLYKGKLDWTLLRGFRVLGRGMDNDDFAASDHKLLHVTVRPVVASEDKGGEPGQVAYGEHCRDQEREARLRVRGPTVVSFLTVGLLVGATAVVIKNYYFS